MSLCERLKRRERLPGRIGIAAAGLVGGLRVRLEQTRELQFWNHVVVHDQPDEDLAVLVEQLRLCART